jgi:HSP20 family molecular chaperone IbpA
MMAHDLCGGSLRPWRVERSFGLPNAVHTAAIRAEYKSGVWTVKMPKRAEPKAKQAQDYVTNKGN